MDCGWMTQKQQRLSQLCKNLRDINQFSASVTELLYWCRDERAYYLVFEDELMTCLAVVYDMIIQNASKIDVIAGERLLGMCFSNRHKMTAGVASRLLRFYMLRPITVRNTAVAAVAGMTATAQQDHAHLDAGGNDSLQHQLAPHSFGVSAAQGMAGGSANHPKAAAGGTGQELPVNTTFCLEDLFQQGVGPAAVGARGGQTMYRNGTNFPAGKQSNTLAQQTGDETAKQAMVNTMGGLPYPNRATMSAPYNHPGCGGTLNATRIMGMGNSRDPTVAMPSSANQHAAGNTAKASSFAPVMPLATTQPMVRLQQAAQQQQPSRWGYYPHRQAASPNATMMGPSIVSPQAQAYPATNGRPASWARPCHSPSNRQPGVRPVQEPGLWSPPNMAQPLAPVSPQSGTQVLDHSAGMISQQPGMMSQQPGMMSHQPGMMSQQPGMLSRQPGIISQRPGMMSQQPGMMSQQPGMMPPKPELFTPPNMMAQPLATMSHPSGRQVLDHPGGMMSQQPGMSSSQPLPQSLADSDTDQLTVAGEVTRDFLQGLSRQDRHALERALKEGQKQIRHGRIITIGPGRSGKSALIRSMLNKLFEHTSSTIGIEVGKVRCTANGQRETLRFEEQNEMFQQKVLMAYDAILDIIKQEKSTPRLPGSPEHPHASAGQKLVDNTSQPQECPPLRVGSKSIPPSDCTSSEEIQCTKADSVYQIPPPDCTSSGEIQCTKAVLKAFIDKLRSHNALKDGILEAFWHFDIWDFAGQKPFEALQQMFLSSARCAYLIVFDATKLLEARYHDEFCDSSGDSYEGNREGCSYFRAFESWLHIVQQVVGDDVDVPVYAVGTHIDEFDAAVRQEELAKVEDRIWKVAENRAYYQNLRKVFFVDNTKSGSDQEDPEIGVLRQELITSMESQCIMPIPISWMPFAPVLDAIAQKLQVRILPLDRVQQIAREACQDEAVDVDGLLSYHHHLGQIIQCRLDSVDSSRHGSLPQAPVIIDTDWLVQATAVLLTPEPLKTRSPRFRKEYKLLFDEGILLESLAIHRWSKSELTQDLAQNADQRQVVLTLLAQFDLLYSSQSKDVPASAPDSRYIVPALVNRPADLQRSLRYHDRTPSYYIVCGKFQLFPQILFWCSLVRLMKGFNTGTQALLYKSRARLLSSSGYWLEMTLFDSGIRLTVEGEEDDAQKLAEACHHILNLLSRDLLTLRSVSLRHVELFQAVRCECTSGDRPCREHHEEHCPDINCFHFARLPLCADPKYSSVPPVFRCPLDALPRAVVDNQPEMRRYWLPDGSKVGITPEQSRGPAPRDFFEPSHLPPEEQHTGITQSLDVHSVHRSRNGNPWESSPYRINYPKLIRLMHPTEVKIKCKSLSLMTWYDEEDVDKRSAPSDKNAQILKVMEVSARKFGRFREILHAIRDCHEVAIELDAVGPERHTDEDCLRARDILENSDR